MQVLSRTELLRLDEGGLLGKCRCEACRGTGPGGQKRNKTSTAIKVTLLQDESYSASDDQERSQSLNKHRALQKLRLNIALGMREAPVAWSGDVPGHRSEEYVLWLAVVLDVMTEKQFSVADTAEALGTSTGKLVRELAKTPAVWQYVNTERKTRGFSQLRAD